MAWLSWISGHPIVDDRAASVLGTLAIRSGLPGRLPALGMVVRRVGFVLARFVWSNGHGCGSFLE
jgi:hypothetical protein